MTNAQPKRRAREVILETAERLFAEQGIEAVSLRTINTEAGYSVAALHYHFKTREKLIAALIDLRQGPILTRRKTMLKALQTSPRPSVRDIVAALVMPLAEPILADSDGGLRTLKFFFRTYVELATDRRVRAVIEQSHRIFNELLVRARPDLDAAVLHQRWIFATELTFQGLAKIDQLTAVKISEIGVGTDHAPYIEQLIDFITGGVVAP
jgi:AcrR family transcriptional regulator